MRATTIVEAILALALGVVVGIAFLYATDELKTPGEIAALERAASEERRRVELEALERQKEEELARERAERERLEKERAEREARALAERERREREERERAEREKAEQTRRDVRVAQVTPEYGRLVVRTLADNLEIDGGPSLRGKGKEVTLNFTDRPGRIRVKGGNFTVTLHPKPYGQVLGLDVSVSPLAIIKANDVATGTTAQGLEVDRQPFKLDFSSPSAGELNLILQYRK